MNPEENWNSAFGPYESRKSVLASASAEGLTVEQYAEECVDAAIDAGIDYASDGVVMTRDEAVKDLLRQLDKQA